MSFIQRLLMSVLPAAWADDMRADSQAWTIRCRCGHERSFWEIGGVRWKAYGNSRLWMRCPRCGTRSWHTTYRRQDRDSAATGRPG